ncbi:MAG: hypothetical protein AW09_004577 [Candidatus Accumulibacter phosphatis]|uniref:Uncharacterized protein n=1 Tax=Candidatus Accumulibacter phosphatis TaxID=327160 RepID=A0A084Y6J4_9PROT|nr:MAG: hypothetical protein AW09_004577 [Candidatus Accumulibacter phosphatis]
MHTRCCLAFAATVRVIDRIHCDAPHCRANAAPTIATGLAYGTQAMLFVTYLTDGRAALDMHSTNLAGTQAELRVHTFAGQQLYRGTSRSRQLCALARYHLDAMNRCTNRNITDRQGVAHLDRRFGTTGDLLTNGQTFRRDDVTALTIGVTKQGNVCGPVRIILKALDLCRNAILVALEINQPIVLLMATTLVPGRDLAVVIPTSVLRLWLEQCGNWLALVQICIDDPDDGATARRGRFDFDECHQTPPPSTKLIS